MDLLVDDVKRENAEGVVLLKRTRWTKLLECALGHLEMSDLKSKRSKNARLYLWKDSVERIVSHVDWLLHLGQHIPAQCTLYFLPDTIFHTIALYLFLFSKIQRNTSLRICAFLQLYIIQVISQTEIEIRVQAKIHLPNSWNWYPRNMSVKKIWPMTLAKLRSSQAKNLRK